MRTATVALGVIAGYDRPMRDGPSITARVVALARSRLERPQTPDGDPDAEDRLYAGLRTRVWWPVSARWRRTMATRTRFFDEVTLAAIEASITQVVIIGAGYDGRALRFRHAGVEFFEVDHPETQPDKRRRVEALGVGQNGVTYVSHDLNRGGLAGALAAAGHAGDRPSLFICEGLLLYLDDDVIAGLLGDLHNCAGPGSRLAVSAREVVTGAPLRSRARAGVFGIVLAAIGEPRRSLPRQGELREQLARAGWSVSEERSRVRGARRGMLVVAEAQAPTKRPVRCVGPDPRPD